MTSLKLLQEQLIKESPHQDFYCNCSLCNSYWAVKISLYPRLRNGVLVTPEPSPGNRVSS